MLGESERQSLGKLELGEVVAICDHLGLLRGAELEHEIARKTLVVAFDLLVEAPGGYTVEFGEVGIDHYLLATQDLDATFDARQQHRGWTVGSGHGCSVSAFATPFCT
jgi:hypothetical protein